MTDVELLCEAWQQFRWMAVDVHKDHCIKAGSPSNIMDCPTCAKRNELDQFLQRLAARLRELP